jgi:hypothetical protein
MVVKSPGRAYIDAGRIRAMVAGPLDEALFYFGKFSRFMDHHLGKKDVLPDGYAVLLLAFYRACVTEKAHGWIDKHCFSHI